MIDINMREVYEAVEEIERLENLKEAALYDNGGEVTDEVNEFDNQVGDLVEDLYNRGATDMLVEYKLKNDASIDYCKERKRDMDARIKRLDARNERLKRLLRFLMDKDGRTEMPRGVYQVKIFDSVKTEGNKDVIEALYRTDTEKALKDVLPADITVEFKASAKKAKELNGTLPDYYTSELTPTVKIIKPRTNS